MRKYLDNPALLILAITGAGGLLAQMPASRTVRFADLPAGIAREFDSGSFDARIREIGNETTGRQRDGEFDHLIYYALQSGRFTPLARIEPALSARDLASAGRTPPAVLQRLSAFLQTLRRSSAPDEPRMRYFARLLAPDQRTVAFLDGEYRRVMRFLYDKEFLHREHLYETRGHSTDTQVEANYAVSTGLSVLKELTSASAIRRVLIVGPGLDLAPRTALVDSHPPQSFQPYAAADALLGLGLSRPGQLTIDCADISARVVEFINGFPLGTRRLDLYSGPGDGEYDRYFRALGGSAGKRSGDRLEVNADVARAVRAGSLNVLTSRWEAQYDLAIATNVLVYFNRQELALALANISSMIRPGGYFLHNEVRPELDGLAAASGLEAVQARTVRVNSRMFDAFVIYRKPPVVRR